jgi:MFS family permease
LTAPAPESLLAKLGIPRLAGNGKFASATAIDSVGTGLVLAFTVVYFVKTTAVSLEAIGAAMTLARLCALPTSLLVGPLIDRFTARRTAITGNLISAVGYGGFLFAHQVWSIGIVVFLVQVGHTTYWTSSGALVALASPEETRSRWFGFIYALRNTGMGVGGALGAFAFALGETTGLHLIVVCNAVSYLGAVLLLSRWRPKGHDQVAHEPAEADPAVAKASYRTVLRDHSYTMLISVNVTLVFAQMLIKVLLAIYIVEALDKAAWIAGTLIVLSTIQIALTQTVINRRMERYRPTRVITIAALLNALAFGLFALLYVAPNVVVIVGLFVAMTLFTFGEIIGFPAIDNLSVAMAPERIRGRYLAVFQLSWTVGEVVAPSLLTFLLATGAILPMVFLLALSLVAVPLLRVLERRTAADRPAAQTKETNLTAGAAAPQMGDL